jgi:transposase-like protein
MMKTSVRTLPWGVHAREEGGLRVPQQTPLTDEQRLMIAELADEGLSVRQIAAQMKIAPSTVTRAAQRMGIAFDRSATEKATAARIADARARRSTTVLRLLELANQELDRLGRPYRTHAFLGGQDPGYFEHVLPQPDATARLTIVRTAGTLIDKHIRLAGVDGQNGDVDHAKSMLGSLMGHLQLLYGDTTDSGEELQT